ncbi:serine hydrolase [Tumidithrix elongata RA019]|uniref:Serine hydrolase n=1 Tax=Tumidithrix elongata BACA0141 TaxID=2716417 RepID=A0AAW9PV59_9CYAN|nr:serine hydrolase [Tumidithrix elongata RA019]
MLALLNTSSLDGAVKSPSDFTVKLSQPSQGATTFKTRSDANVIAETKPATKPTSFVKPLTPKAAIERLFTTPKLQDNWFTAEFLAQVSTAQIEALIANLKPLLGTYKQVKESGKNYVVIGDRATIPATIALNDKGQISGLYFGNPTINDVNDVVKGFKGLPGKVGLLVIEGNSARISINSDMPLAVGSAFKLAVLKALKSQIASGKHTWGDAIALKAKYKVLPTGILQTWPEGSLLTIQSAASLMISLSDNTATDMLIDLVGREKIEAIASRNRPLLTLREFFVLKSSQNSELLKRYHAGNEAERKSILTELAKLPLPKAEELSLIPSIELEAEWFLTNGELCALIGDVADLPLMSINPGIANPTSWEKIAFKGGSDVGVLNLTTWLKAKNGKTYCVSATWNNTTALEESKFFSLYSALLESLK